MVNDVDSHKDDSESAELATPISAAESAAIYLAKLICNALNGCFLLASANNPSSTNIDIGCIDGDVILFMNVLKIFFTSLMHFHKFPILVERLKRNHFNGDLVDGALAWPTKIISTATVSDVLLAAEYESHCVLRIFNRFLLNIDCGKELWFDGIERAAERIDTPFLMDILNEILRKYVS